MTQTNLDLTDKQPTALMRLEAVLLAMTNLEPEDDIDLAFKAGILTAINKLNDFKPCELAILKQAFCEGGIETESAETWAKKWGQPNQP
jgi:hypothetical protein